MKGGENMENCKIKSLVICTITGLICGMLLASVMIIAASNLITTQINTQTGAHILYRDNTMTHREDSTPAPTGEEQ